MGNDFEARKRSKKRGKSDIDAEIASEGRYKNKKRRAAVRSICKGMCYNHPELTEEDRMWTEDASDDETHRDRKLAQAAITEQNRVQEAEKAKAEALKLSRQKAKERRKLSTGVQLLDPDQLRASKRQKTSPEGSSTVLSEAMLAFPEVMQKFMQDMKYPEPTPVQERSWPVILKGLDLTATAEPGSGKTLAYLLPALALLERLSPEVNDSPLVLVLVPTRELAQQVAAVASSARRLGFHTACIHGGTEKSSQEANLKACPQIVVATPGRLLDLVEDNSIFLGAVKSIVLDEADKMLSMGLKPQLNHLKKLLLPSKARPAGLLSVAKQRPQVLLMTATWTEEVEAAAAKWQKDSVRVQVGASSASISRTITQVVQVCAEHKKPQKLLKHLQQIKERSKGVRNPPKVLIFANRVKTVRFLSQTLSAEEYRVVLLHGERSQSERELRAVADELHAMLNQPMYLALCVGLNTSDEAMLAFRSGKAQIMVATDVAARGLHIKGLPYIVNYDFPTNMEQYIHRAGRTGRLALQGHCFSFFTRNLAPLAEPLMSLLQEHGQTIDPNLEKLAEAFQIASKKLGTRPAEQQDTENPSCDQVHGDDADILAQLFGGSSANTQGKGSASGRNRALPGRLRKKLKKQSAIPAPGNESAVSQTSMSEMKTL